MRSPRRRAKVGAIGIALIAAAWLASCGSPRAVLNTSQSSCYRALPAATEAVAHQGRFAGLRRVSVGSDPSTMFGAGLPLTSFLRSSATVTPTTAPRPNGAACLVAFKGSFDPAKMPLLRGTNRSGRYAVVVVGLRASEARAVYLTDHLPRDFTHL